MPVTFSAKKRVRRNERACGVNRIRRGKVKAAEKLFIKTVAVGDAAKAVSLFPKLQASLAKGVKWGMLHRKRASAKTARFASMLCQLSA